MRYVSIFSGVEAATLAWEPLGWEPLAFCEIDDFPSAVLAERWPNVPNLGDITKVDWKKEIHGAVDLVVGGSPCQSFSIAGKREGLKGASGLMFEYIRCVQELMPRWFLWENVKGALSCEGGAAFGQLLGEMDALGYGLAWRVLDAQFFGVAQRRERLFLVGHLGDARACEVLFEPESMCWDTPSSREKRKAVAAASGRSVAQGSGTGRLNPDSQHDTFSIAGNIIGSKPENGGNGWGFQEPGEPMYTLTTIDRPAVAFKYHQCSKAGGIGAAVEQSPTLTADYHNPAVMYEESETCTAGLSETGQANQGGGKGPLIQDEISGTLSTVNNQSLVCMTDTQKNTSVDDEIAGTISAHTRKDPPVVAFKNHQGAANGSGADESEPIAGYHNINDNTTAESGINSVVRRLTPLECERLQGFPDNHTRIPWKGKPAEECPDSLRYKACGNSMAVPVMRWLGERIEAVDRL
jgi:DNA (cytosine-5)-methyltransferase 1